MKSLFALMLSLTVAGAACAQEPQPGAGGPQPRMVRRMMGPIPPPAFVGEQGEAVLDLSGGSPVVTVEIGGRPFRFLIDTGAGGHGRLTAAAAAALGLTPTGDTARATDGSGRVQMRGQFTVPELTVAGVRFTGLTVSELPVMTGPRAPRVDGILGLDLFGNHTLTLDYAGGRMRLTREALPTDAMAYERGPAGVGLTLRVGDVSLPARLDTGNSVGALIVPEAALSTLPVRGEVRTVGRARTAISEVEIRDQELSSPVRLGDVTLPVTRVTFPALGEMANLGSRGLEGMVLTLDQRNRRLALEPGVRVSTTAPPPAPAADVAAVRAAERRWLAAYEQNDADAMSPILAEDFTITYAHGVTMNRTRTLAEVRASTETIRYCTFDTQARMVSEGMVLQGTVLMQGGRGAQAMRYTDLWVRDGATWRVRRSELGSPTTETGRTCG